MRGNHRHRPRWTGQKQELLGPAHPSDCWTPLAEDGMITVKDHNTMIVAYSRLPKILAERRLSVPELHRRLQQENQAVNIKSLYRLNDPRQPLARLDLRVAGAICQLCEVTLADLVDFSGQGAKLATLPSAKQERLDVLMDRSNEGKLSRKEQRELQDLVRETQEITLHNARILAEQQRRLERE